MTAVHPGLPLRDLVTTFLKVMGPAEEVQAKDPLGLSSDRPLGPPPAPPFTASMLPSGAAVAAGLHSGTSAPPQSKRKVVLLQQTLAPAVVRPTGLGEQRGVAADEGETLELSDPALVSELSADGEDSPMEGVQQVDPHPGYFTAAGREQLKQSEGQEETRSPSSVEFVGYTERVFYPTGGEPVKKKVPMATTGSNSLPLGVGGGFGKGRTEAAVGQPGSSVPRVAQPGTEAAGRQLFAAQLSADWPPLPPPPQQPMGQDDLRWRLGGGQAALDLRQRIEARGGKLLPQALPLPSNLSRFDVRSQLQVETDATAFAAEAATSVDAAALPLPPTGQGDNFR